MPADPSIYGLQEPVKINTPFESLSRILQVRQQQESARGLAEQRQAIAEQRREQTERMQRENDDRAAMGSAIQKGGGVRAQTLAEALKSAPNTVPMLTEFFDKADNSAASIKKLRLEAKNLEADFFGDVAFGVKKTGGTLNGLKTALAYTVEQFPDYAEQAQKIAAQLENAQPEQVNSFLDQIISQAPSRRAMNKPPENYTLGNRRMSGETNQPIATAAPEPVAPAKLGSLEDTIQRYADARRIPVAKLSHGDVLKATAQHAAAGRAPTQGPQQGYQWVNRGGKEVYTNRTVDGDKRPSTASVKPTEDERKMVGFYGKMSDAIKTIDELEGALTEKELYQIQTVPQEKLIGMMNRNQLSEGAKRYLRAFEQFTEADLRPISGAAIQDSEYQRNRRTYAKQYGETPNLAADRKQARNRALESLKKRAGVALDDVSTDASKPKVDPLGIR